MISSLVEFADATKTLLEDYQEELEIHSIFYGDQQKLPGTPVVCIEPDTKANDLVGSPRAVNVRFTVQILVYTAAINSPQINQRDADVLAEKIEDILHLDPQLGERVIHCMVDSIQSGYARKSGTLVRANKIQFSGQSKVRLPLS